MKFTEIGYLKWVRERVKRGVGYPLLLSGIRDISRIELEKLGFSLKDIETKGGHNDFGGLVELKETIARRYRVSPANVTLAAGASMAIFTVSSALLNPGDEVIIEYPCYEPILRVPEALGCRIKRLPRRFSDGFQPDLAELKRLLTKRVKLIYLTNLHNPSGVQIAPEVIHKISRLARQSGAHLVSNEIYLQYFGEGFPFHRERFHGFLGGSVAF